MQNKLGFLFILVASTSCGTIQQMNTLVTDSTDSINANREAVEYDTWVIQENARIINDSTRTIQENRRVIDESTRAIQENHQHILDAEG